MNAIIRSTGAFLCDSEQLIPLSKASLPRGKIAVTMLVLFLSRSAADHWLKGAFKG